MKAPFGSLLVTTALLLPLTSIACERELRACQRDISTLITYRAEAIAGAFGNVYGGRAESLQIRFPKRDEPANKRLAGGIGYDPVEHTFWISRSVVSMTVPNPMNAALYYWPFYQRPQLRKDFPVIEIVDNALWAAFLRDSANANGLQWPHPACSSTVVRERLPCEMLTTGIARFVKVLSEPIFNENRLDRLWPEDIAAFDRRVSGYNDREYLEVQRLGGLLLVRPLIKEFGVLPAFAYIARTPFVVENDNVRLSALRYQERARTALNQYELRPPGSSAAAKVQQVPPLD